MELFYSVPKAYPLLTGQVSSLSGVVTVQGTQCVLPFSYNNTAYEACLAASNGVKGA